MWEKYYKIIIFNRIILNTLKKARTKNFYVNWILR